MIIKNIANEKITISNTENSIDNTKNSINNTKNNVDNTKNSIYLRFWNRLKYFYSKYSNYIIPILISGTTFGLTYVVYTFLLNTPKPGFFPPNPPNPPPRPSRPSMSPMIPPRPFTPPCQPPLPPQYPSPSSPFINPSPPINPILENDLLIISEYPLDYSLFASYKDCEAIAIKYSKKIKVYPPESIDDFEEGKESYCILEGNIFVYTVPGDAPTVSETFNFVEMKRKSCKENPFYSNCFFRNPLTYFSPRSPPSPSTKKYSIIVSEESFENFELAHEFCNQYLGIACPYTAEVLNMMYILSNEEKNYFSGYELFNHEDSVIYGCYSPEPFKNAFYSTQLKYESIPITSNTIDVKNKLYEAVNYNLAEKVLMNGKNFPIVSFYENNTVKINTSETKSHVFCYTDTYEEDKFIIKGKIIKECYTCDEYCCPKYDGNKYISECKNTSIIYDERVSMYRKCTSRTFNIEFGSQTICTEECNVEGTSIATDNLYEHIIPKSNNGRCDDGGPYTLYNDENIFCNFGSDCIDCGIRTIETNETKVVTSFKSNNPFNEIVLVLTENGFISKGEAVDSLKVKRNVPLNIITESADTIQLVYESIYCTIKKESNIYDYCQYVWPEEEFVEINSDQRGEKISITVTDSLSPPPPPCQTFCNNSCVKNVDFFEIIENNYVKVGNGTTQVTSDNICDTDTGEFSKIHYKNGQYYILKPENTPCDIGSDCDDCGPQCLETQQSSCSDICSDDCILSNNFECDDGGLGSEYSICNYGHDCNDCGLRCTITTCVPFIYNFLTKNDVSNYFDAYNHQNNEISIEALIDDSSLSDTFYNSMSDGGGNITFSVTKGANLNIFETKYYFKIPTNFAYLNITGFESNIVFRESFNIALVEPSGMVYNAHSMLKNEESNVFLFTFTNPLPEFLKLRFKFSKETDSLTIRQLSITKLSFLDSTFKILSYPFQSCPV